MNACDQSSSHNNARNSDRVRTAEEFEEELEEELEEEGDMMMEGAGAPRRPGSQEQREERLFGTTCA